MKKTKSTVKSVKKNVKKKVSKKTSKKKFCPKCMVDKVKSCLVKFWKKAIVVIGVVGLLVYFKSLIIVGFVNNRPLWRITFNNEMERQVGTQVLDTMATKAMIKMEAKKLGVKVEPSEIDKEMERLEGIAKQQEMGLDELLALQGITRKQVLEEINLQKSLEKMVEGEVEVTQEEITQALETNSKFLPKEATNEELESMVKEQLVQQKMQVKMQDWVTKLKENFKVVSWL